MADALAKYRAALKRYRKENPKVAYATAQKRVSAEMKGGKVSGPKKKRKIAAAAPHKTAIAGTRRKTTTKRKATVKRMTAAKKSVSRMDRSAKLLRDIERLEIKRKQEKAREMRDIIQLEINALHDKLDTIKRTYKRKSA